MCTPKTAVPTAVAAAPAPTRADATASTDPTALAQQARMVAQKRQGVFGNINTTPLGDASYGSASVARFG